MINRILSGQTGSLRGLASGWLLGPIWNRRNRALNDTALRAMELQPVDRVLEVGFGGGYLLGRMTSTASAGLVAGVDVSPALVARCLRRFRGPVKSGRMDLRIATAEALPFPEAHVNKVVSVNSIFYWPDAPRAMAEISRVLHPGGRLVMVFTDKQSMQDRPIGRIGLALYDAETMRRLLAACGFQECAFSRHTDRHRVFWCVTAAR